MNGLNQPIMNAHYTTRYLFLYKYYILFSRLSHGKGVGVATHFELNE